MWLKENRENRITCFGGCSSFRGSISLRDFSSCGPNLRAQIGWGRNLVSETRASSPLFGKSSSAPFYIHNHRCNRRFRNLVSRHRGTASDITRYRSRSRPPRAKQFSNGSRFRDRHLPGPIPQTTRKGSSFSRLSGASSVQHHPSATATANPTFALRGHFPGRRSVSHLPATPIF